jgi:hypothetical protein
MLHATGEGDEAKEDRAGGNTHRSGLLEVAFLAVQSSRRNLTQPSTL